MARVRGIDELGQALHDELDWRKRELQLIKSQIDITSGPVRKVILRAAIALLYAHWEGAVKTCARLFIEHVCERLQRENLCPKDLAPHMQALVFWTKAKQGLEARGPGDFVRQLGPLIQASTAQKPNVDIFNTIANLDYKTLRDVLSCLLIPEAEYFSKENLIDNALVDRRHKIAHGQRFDPDVSDFVDLYPEIISLMELFRNQVENAAATKNYLLSP